MVEDKKIFRSQADSEEDFSYFNDAYPDFPNKAHLEEHVNAIALLKFETFFHYLPLFLECLREQWNGAQYDMLIHAVEAMFDNIPEDCEDKYADIISEGRAFLGEYYERWEAALAVRSKEIS